MGAMEYSPQIPVNATRRYAVRSSLLLRGQSEDALDKNPSIVIRNISSTGCLLETSELLTAGSTITVSLANGHTFTAKVVWTEGFKAGCSFRKPLSKADYAAALLASDPARRESLMVTNYAPRIANDVVDFVDYPRWPRGVRVAVLAGLSILIWVALTLPIL